MGELKLILLGSLVMALIISYVIAYRTYGDYIEKYKLFISICFVIIMVFLIVFMPIFIVGG